jgi:hypothetical protein
MNPHALRLATIAALLAAGAGLTARAAAPEPGTYACTNRGGNEIAGRRFTLGASGEAAGGTYQVQGNKVFVRGGALGGHQMLLLPDGRLRLSRHVFCGKVAPLPQEAAAPPPPAPPEPPPRPEPKLIIVKPGAH